MKVSWTKTASLVCLAVMWALTCGCQEQQLADGVSDAKTTPVENRVEGTEDESNRDEASETTENEKKAEIKMLSAPTAGYQFEEPVRIKAGDEFIAVHSPGYACPTMADVDGDGLEDLVVGQFNKGLMWFCKNIADSPSETPKFDKSDWIRSDGKRAQVPGVW